MTTDLERLRIDPAMRSLEPGNGRSRRKVIIWIAVIVVLLVIAIMVASGSARTVEVHVVPAGAAKPPGSLSATGYIVAKDPVSITPEVSGKVLRVGPDVGETVVAGQILVEIDSSTFMNEHGANAARRDELERGSRPAEIGRAKALFDEAAALHRKALADLDRAMRLEESGAISKSELDRTRRDFEAARSHFEASENEWKLVRDGPRREQIDVARHTAASSRIALDRTVIRSPIDGIVVRKEVTPGEYVIAGQGVGLRDVSTPAPYIVANLGEMEAIVEISEREIGRVSPGMPAVIRPDALPDSAFRGVVARITPFAYRQKGTIELRVRMTELSPLLKHDMNARVEFGEGISTSKLLLRIPARAVRSDEKGTYALLVENNAAVRRDIKSAPSQSSGEVIVESGLDGGERLILDADVKVGESVKER